jgi:NAD(P)-dependent dehydrogenase (short-subunit alcohol dehydrogenase family)
MFDLTGEVAVVTGASRGLGRSMARALAVAGAEVALASRTASHLKQVADEIKDLGRDALVLPCDVGDYYQLQGMLETAFHEMGKIDILVNNAGIALYRSFKEISYKEWRSYLDVNLNSAFGASKAVVPHMVKKGKGKIINISSVLGLRANWQSIAYCTTKAALIQFTRGLAFELGRYNINVNAIGPGWFKTDMTKILEDNPDAKKAILRRIPLGRMGDPRELDGAIVFLASHASDYMTGQTIFVDGGFLTS